MNGLEVEFLFRINFSLHVKPDVFMKYQDELVSHAVGAEPSGAIDHQQQHIPQQIQQGMLQHPQPHNVQTVVMQQTHQQQQQPHVVNYVPVNSNMTQNISTQIQATVGNVTPSPPQNNMDQSQHHHQKALHDMTFVHHYNHQQPLHPHQQQINQPQLIQPSTKDYPMLQQPQQQIPKSIDHHPIQQGHQHPRQQQHNKPIKNYQIQNSNIHPTDVIFATCCPYGGRLNTNNSSSTGLFHTAARIYQ
jgi:hypothetical protein